MEPGETIAQTATREAKEETGLEIEIGRLIGTTPNPNHVVEYSNGEVRQQFSVCFAGTAVGGKLATSDESLDVGFFDLAEIEQLPIDDSIRRRIRHFLEHRKGPGDRLATSPG